MASVVVQVGECNNVKEAKEVVGGNTKIIHALNSIAIVRFDTTIVRNLIFITNLHRILRKTVADELTHYRSVITRAHRAPNRSLTEFGATSEYGLAEISTDGKHHSDSDSKVYTPGHR